MANKTFIEGQRVQITRGIDRGKAGSVHSVITSDCGGPTIYVISADSADSMNTRAPAVRATSLKAI